MKNLHESLNDRDFSKKDLDLIKNLEKKIRQIDNIVQINDEIERLEDQNRYAIAAITNTDPFGYGFNDLESAEEVYDTTEKEIKEAYDKRKSIFSEHRNEFSIEELTDGTMVCDRIYILYNIRTFKGINRGYFQEIVNEALELKMMLKEILESKEVEQSKSPEEVYTDKIVEEATKKIELQKTESKAEDLLAEYEEINDKKQESLDDDE